jgi:two-component system chemotaxis response regulator CheB
LTAEFCGENLSKSARFKKPRVIAIGCSTGGPQALLRLLPALPPRICQPIFITQHMPARFIRPLAQEISRQSARGCHEPINGEIVKDRVIYLAPGDFHLSAKNGPEGKRIALLPDPPRRFCRPSVDLMLQGLAEAYDGAVLAGILSGMGSDGVDGCRCVAEAGGIVLVQDEASSVVWGMPGSVVEGGLAHGVVPLQNMADTMGRYVEGV